MSLPFRVGAVIWCTVYLSIVRYVYLITNKVNGKVYVGQTKDFTQRKAGHLYGARKGYPQLIYRSIRKHGEENFSFEILEECDDLVIDEREQRWIAHYDSFNSDKGYNLTHGGGGRQGYVASEQTRIRLRNAWAKRRITGVSDETKRKMSKALTGRRISQTTRDKIRATRLGQTLSHESKMKVSIASKSRFGDDVFRQKHSAAVKLAMQNLSNEQRVKLSNRKRAIVQIQHEHVVAEFASIIEASKKLGLSYGMISHALNGRVKEYKGYIWKYKNAS